MSTRAAHTAVPAASYTPLANRDALIAEYIGHILAGTQYPDALRPPATPARRPASAREGIEWMLQGMRN